MDNCVLTETMKIWLKELYLEKAKDHKETASNCHLWALGSDDAESAAQWEYYTEEHREFAHILECLAKELELDDKENN